MRPSTRLLFPYWILSQTEYNFAEIVCIFSCYKQENWKKVKIPIRRWLVHCPREVYHSNYRPKSLKEMCLKTTRAAKNVKWWKWAKKIVFREKSPPIQFWQSGPPSLDTPKSWKCDKWTRKMQNFMTIPIKWSKCAFGVDFGQLTFCGPKIWRKWTISLFVYYNFPDHLFLFFGFTYLLSRTVKKIMKIHLKRLEIVCILTLIFLSKSECPDKMRSRVGHVYIGPPKLILCKTRHDSHGVEKKFV